MRLTEQTPEEPRGMTLGEARAWAEEKLLEAEGKLRIAEMRVMTASGDVLRVSPCLVSAETGDVIDVADVDDVGNTAENLDDETALLVFTENDTPSIVRYFVTSDENAPLYKRVDEQEWTDTETSAHTYVTKISGMSMGMR